MVAIVKNGRQSPHTTRVNIPASNPPKIEILLSKYTFSWLLITNKAVLNTLDPQICFFVAPPSQLWFDGISGFPCHTRSHFYLLLFA